MAPVSEGRLATSCHGNMGSPLPFHYLAVMSDYEILALLLQSSLNADGWCTKWDRPTCIVLRPLWSFTVMRVVQCDRGTIWCGFVDVTG